MIGAFYGMQLSVCALRVERDAFWGLKNVTCMVDALHVACGTGTAMASDSKVYSNVTLYFIPITVVAPRKEKPKTLANGK